MGAKHLDPTEASFRQLLNDYRRNAKKRGYVFRLSTDQFRTLTKQECFYCGRAPIQRILRSDGRAPYFYNGIDRLDNSIGYTLSNCVSCCKTCNYAKLERSTDDFVSDIVRAAANLLTKRVTIKLKR